VAAIQSVKESINAAKAALKTAAKARWRRHRAGARWRKA